MKQYQVQGVEQASACYAASQKPNRRYTCAELGICNCEGLARYPGQTCQPEPRLTVGQRAAYALTVALTIVATVFVVCGVSVWAYT